MSIEHETFLETAEKKVLEGYITALTHVRDTIEHTDSKVINELQRWLEDSQAKLTTLTEEEAAVATASAAKVPAAGKPVGGEGSAASSPAADAANTAAGFPPVPGTQASVDQGYEGTKGDPTTQASTAQGTTSAAAEAGALTQDNAKSAA